MMLPTAQVFASSPADQGLGTSNGFEIQMEDRGQSGPCRTGSGAHMLLGLAAQDRAVFAQVFPNSLMNTPQRISTSTRKRPIALGISHRQCQCHLSAAWGGQFSNNFIDRSRVKRVYMQGDAPFRMTAEDLDRWYVRTGNGHHGALLLFLQPAHWTVGAHHPHPLITASAPSTFRRACGRRQHRHGR